MIELHHNAKDLTNKKFGRLLVVRPVNSKKTGQHWLCQCECGAKKILKTARMVSGGTLSCGCITKDRNTTHGLSKTDEYNSWFAMKHRCYNKNDVSYKYYGGRGIRVCNRWLNSLENFIHDMGKRPQGYSIERSDTNKDYEPSNCKWASSLEQCNNRRSNTLLTCNGKTQTIAEWKREMGLNTNNIECRLKAGWSVYRAINTLTRNYGRNA